MTHTFPFDAVVGQADAKLALRLVAVDPRLGGVLLRGDKGSAKTTLARGLAELLGAGPDGAVPFVELPVGATEDRLVGSLDTRAALSGGEIVFHPGLLAAADGGVLYVDEVNLLPDHLVDVLLDVAVSGQNRVERDGVSHRHASRFVLIGSMNPEEGELRPQLLDRFGLCVHVTAGSDPAERAEAVRRRLAFDRGEPIVVAGGDEPSASSLGDVVSAAVGDEVIAAATRLALAVGAEGLRADLTLCRAAAALAGFEGRDTTSMDDIERIAHLALAHRSRRGPFDPPVIPPEALRQAIGEALEEPAPPEPDDEIDDESGDERFGGTGDRSDRSPGGADRPLALGVPRRPPGDPRRPRPVRAERGRTVGDVAAGPGDRVSVVATARRRATTHAALDDPDTIRTATRVATATRTVVLCVDLSGSMGVADRAEAASGTVLGLLTGAYERRDRVALVTFGRNGAQVVLSPTASVEVARHRLAHLTTGGETPLGPGLLAALAVAERVRPAESDVLLAVLTDGRATGGADALDRARDAAVAIRAASVPAVVVDCETGPTRLGLAIELAELMGARHVAVDTITPDTIGTAITGARP
ncbi:MAG: AAA family ATPase [Desertimonas sp.]